MKFNVHLYPIVRVTQEIEANSAEEAAVLMKQQFDGSQYNFGNAVFADGLDDFMISDPLDANGEVIYSGSKNMTMAEVDYVEENMKNDGDEEIASPSM